jgi:hypothetical protein
LQRRAGGRQAGRRHASSCRLIVIELESFNVARLVILCGCAEASHWKSVPVSVFAASAALVVAAAAAALVCHRRPTSAAKQQRRRRRPQRRATPSSADIDRLIILGRHSLRWENIIIKRDKNN